MSKRRKTTDEKKKDAEAERHPAPPLPQPKRTFTKELRCALTPPQWSTYAERLAHLNRLIADEKARAKDAAASASARVKGLEGEAREVAEKVRSHEELRLVECYERHAVPDTLFAVEVIRMDTDGIVETRPMTASERNAIVNPTLPGVHIDPQPTHLAPSEIVSPDKPPEAQAGATPPMPMRPVSVLDGLSADEKRVAAEASPTTMEKCRWCGVEVSSDELPNHVCADARADLAEVPEPPVERNEDGASDLDVAEDPADAEGDSAQPDVETKAQRDARIKREKRAAARAEREAHPRRRR